jgi:hypothetical protein
MKILHAIPSLTLLSAALFLLFTPVSAWSQIYKWTDEEGMTVYSNVRPAPGRKPKDLELLLEEEKPVPPGEAARRSMQAAQDEAIRKEQALQQRVDKLERTLQALQYREEMASVPPPPYGYYESLDPTFGFPYAYGFSYAVPARVMAPGRALRSPVITSRGVVNSGPVFATPAVPSSRFVPGVFTPGFSAPKGFPSRIGSQNRAPGTH